MKKNSIVVLLLVLSAFAAGSWHQKRTMHTQAGARAVLYYTDPMHPSYRSDEPGTAPDCGMDLVPVYAEDAAGGPGPAATPPGSVRIQAERQQLIGVRIEEAKRAAGSRVIHTLGRIATDETRIYRINAAVDGWIRKTYPNSVGSVMQEGETLATFYAPEFLGAQQAYLFALLALDRLQSTGKETQNQLELTTINIKQYRDGLRNLAMEDQQIEEMGKSRKLADNIRIMAPVTGFVQARNISPGQRFDKGSELYRIADLTRVWILADVFESEMLSFRPGMTARVIVNGTNRSFTARVSDTLPQFDAASRTVKIRLEADNPGYLLRPDMFVEVDFTVPLSPGISVPVDAVIDSGLKKTVYIDRGNGLFEPRTVETGARYGERVRILSGLAAGERVVVSGNFLIDSESRMRTAAAQAVGMEADPVCGNMVNTDKARATGMTTVDQGRTWYFCCKDCKEAFGNERMHGVPSGTVKNISTTPPPGEHHD